MFGSKLLFFKLQNKIFCSFGTWTLSFLRLKSYKTTSQSFLVDKVDLVSLTCRSSSNQIFVFIQVNKSKKMKIRACKRCKIINYFKILMKIFYSNTPVKFENCKMQSFFYQKNSFQISGLLSDADSFFLTKQGFFAYKT